MRQVIIFLFFTILFSNRLSAQLGKELWNMNQLVETETLANRINQKQTANTIILSIGPDAVIKGSVNIGSTYREENIEKLKNYLKNVSKNKEIIIYCGCCPFDKCPNIRPAFKVLKGMGFKNAKLLNIPKKHKN